MTRRVVGVLGGMGPEATILLQHRLLGLVDARDDADHLPLLIDMNPQVPSRIAHLIEGQGADPGPVLGQMARRLAGAGATALAMPCNTAHHYARWITDATDVPFLNMVDLSIAATRARVPAGAAVGVLASPAVKRAGVFDRAAAHAQLPLLWPADDDALLGAIRHIKSSGPTDASRETLSNAATELIQAGATILLIGCSEFSLLASQVNADMPFVDTVDVLAEAIRDHIQDQAS